MLLYYTLYRRGSPNTCREIGKDKRQMRATSADAQAEPQLEIEQTVGGK
jgi:hypothetical protein